MALDTGSRPTAYSHSLSPRQTRALLARARAGDSRAEEILIRHSEKRLYRAVNRLDCPVPLLDDLYQEGAIAVRAAIHTYDSERGLSWASYSYRAARCQMINALEARKNLPTSYGTNSEILDSLTSGEDGPEQAALFSTEAARVREHLSRLEPREQAVVNSHYGFEGPARTLTALAGELGVTYQRTQQLRDRALGKLYRNMSPGSSPASEPAHDKIGAAA